VTTLSQIVSSWSLTISDDLFVLGEHIEVVHVQNAHEAVELIGQFTPEDRPDLFVVDLRLPNNGGLWILSADRGTSACERVPMFVVTSSGYDRDTVESYRLGASAVLLKPFSRAIFREEITRVGLLRDQECTKSMLESVA
jgi:DNA-binding response OmpR family regulator